jgi:Protein of unknown function (DUF1573)
MKKLTIIFFASFIAFVAYCHSAAVFNWSKTQHDFGTITKGTPVSHEFEFTNSGSEPLIVTNVVASCGCTVTNYSKDPIAPGGNGYVRATFDAGKLGAFVKTVTVQSNTSENPILTLKGTVVE